MAGETVKTHGTVLTIHPWSRTSHIVTWLTPSSGPVGTLVKGAVRPKSAFLGQYDLFYTCEIVYYAHASGDLHALREAVPVARRDALRGRWRETALASYACDLARELAPCSHEAASWHAALDAFLDRLAALPPATDAPGRLRELIRLEMDVLARAGLAPDFSGLDAAAPWSPFAVDRGHAGTGARTVRLTPATVATLRGTASGNEEDAVRFLGVFLNYHLERPVDMRRTLVELLK